MDAESLGGLKDFAHKDFVWSVICEQLEHIIEITYVLIGENQVVFHVIFGEDGLLFWRKGLEKKEIERKHTVFYLLSTGEWTFIARFIHFSWRSFLRTF